MNLSSLTIGRRLALGFLLVMLTTVAVAAIGVSRVATIENHLTTVNDVNAVKQRHAINFRGSVHDRAIALRDVVMAQTPQEVSQEVALIDSLTADYSASAAPLAQIFADPQLVDADEIAALGQIERIEAETLPLIDEVIALQTAGDTDRAYTLLVAEAKPLFVDWLAAINVLIDLEEDMNAGETASARSIAGGFMVMMVLLVLIAAALATLVAWWVVRSITRPLGRAVDVLAAVADGDLSARLDVSSKDEVGRMARSLNAALATIEDVIGSLAARSQSLTRMSGRIGQLSGDIAGGAQRSASEAGVVSGAAEEVSRNVQSVAAGTEQMGAAIEDIARNAGESATVAREAVATVDKTSLTIGRLGETGRTIGAVVQTITSIAEQTNLLALNATIEAARAGEAGKGFAVVAGEVKDLAQETARATEDISRRVEAVHADTGEAVAAIAEVQAVMSKLHDFQMSIASAVEEQTATTGEMNRSITDAASSSEQIATGIVGVAQVAESTSVSVEESERAAQELAQIADELQGLVARFRFSAAHAAADVLEAPAASAGTPPEAARAVATQRELAGV